MVQNTDDISIHAKKYYRVLLKGFDPKKENQESFAIKLSVRTRTPLSRVRHALRNAPYPLKNGLNISHANRLKSALEEIGGIAEIEAYFETPGQRRTVRPGRPHGGDLQSSTTRSPAEGTVVCPSCGWEEGEDAEFCSLCLALFKPLERGSEEASEQSPGDNPLESDAGPPKGRVRGAEERVTAADDSFFAQHSHWIYLGVIVLLILLLVLK